MLGLGRPIELQSGAAPRNVLVMGDVGAQPRSLGASRLGHLLAPPKGITDVVTQTAPVL